MAEGDVTRARSSRWPLRHARALRRSAVPGTFFVEEMDAISSSLTEDWEGAAGGRLEPPVVVASGDERPTRARGAAITSRSNLARGGESGSRLWP